MVTENALATRQLHLVHSLAGTITDDGDALGTRDDAVSWLRAAGLLAPDAVITGSEHGALTRLRDALRDCLRAAAGSRADPDAAARLTRALADGRLVVTITTDGAAALAAAARSPYPSVVAGIAVAIAGAAQAGAWPPQP